MKFTPADANVYKINNDDLKSLMSTDWFDDRKTNETGTRLMKLTTMRNNGMFNGRLWV